MSEENRYRPGWFPLQDISPEEEERVRNFFVGDGDEVEDDAEPYEYESDFDDTEADFAEEENGEVLEPAIDPNRGQKYTGQGKNNKTVWWSMPSEIEKDRVARMKNNRRDAFPSSKGNFEDKKSAFVAIFKKQIIGRIVIETNRKAKKIYEQNRHSARPKSLRKWRDTTIDEVYAYMAILLHAGAEKANHVRAVDLFDKANMPFYRAVMSPGRFEQLSRFIRFDDSRTRLVRLREDKLAPIRYIWQLFLANLETVYVSSLELCIDE